MTKLLALLIVLPSLSWAQTTHYQGTVHQTTIRMQSPQQKEADEKRKRQVFVEVTVSPAKDNVKIRTLEAAPTNPNGLNFKVAEFKKQGAGWILTTTTNPKPAAANVTFTGSNVRSASASFTPAKAKVNVSWDFTNPLVAKYQTQVLGANGQQIMAEHIDAGLILPNQFENQMKGKQVAAAPKPTPFKPPANNATIQKKWQAIKNEQKK